MRKFKWLFIFTLFFLILPSYVKAFPNGYAYDINSVDVVGSNLVIEGWAAIDGSGPIHNIDPTYTLTIVGRDNNNKQVGTSGPYKNLRTYRPGYSSGTAMPRDYTKPWYTKTSKTITKCGTPAYYPNDFTSKRGCVVNESLSSGNRFYINIDFKFEVPIERFKTLLKKAKRIYLNLNVSTSAGTHKVFGYSGFRSVTASKTIPLAIKADRVTRITKEKFQGLSFNATPTRICLNVSSGFVQGNLDKFLGAGSYPLYYDKENKIIRKMTPTDIAYDNLGWNVRKVSYYGSSTSSVGQPLYNIRGSKSLNDANNDAEYFYYTVRVGYDKNYKVKDESAVTSKIITSYIPAFWAVAEPGVLTYITGEDEPVITDPCLDITDAEKRYCCYYPKDAEVCGSKKGQYPEVDPVNKPSTCQSGGATSVTFKYPEKGWGHSVLKNNACLISCQEELKATFQPSQYVKAGMGFTYPVNMNSSRYCTAQYDNPGWKKKVDTAAKAANTAYKDMVIALEKAEDLDNKCGGKERLEKNPRCSTECPDRNGGICSGSKCGTCTDYDKPIYCKKPSNKICGYETYPCYGTTSVTCPSGYTYSGSIDKCVKYVCSKDNSKLWSSAQKEIGDKITSASSALSQYDTNVKRINDLNGERNTCDNYVSLNQYKGAFSTSISTSNVPNQSGYVSTSASFNEDVSFESGRQSKETKYAIFQCYDRPYYESVTLVGDYKSRAKTFTGIYCEYKTVDQKYRDFWNKKSDADINLEFSTLYYVQRYTGELSTASSSGYDRHGRYAYTGFYDYSGSNGFSLAVTNIGPNLAKVSNSLWSINPFTCEYTVDNLIFPPNGDINNEKYGNVAFMFRQISLNDPFPGRQPHRNWSGKEKLITSNGYGVYAQQPLYAIGLNPRIMRDVRKEKVGYASFNIKNPYKSELVKQLIDNRVIIKRK